MFAKKNNVQALMIVDMTVIKKKNTSNSEMRENLHEEENRNEKNSSYEKENQIDVENNDN